METIAPRLRLPFLSATTLLPLRCRRFSTTTITSSSHQTPSPPKLQPPPLFLRPLSHSTSPSSLLSFRHWAETLARSPDLTLDGGPSPSDLLLELSWLLQDTTSPAQNSFLLRTHLDDLYRLWALRISERRPFQYIVGCQHWHDLVLAVTEGVLIPRPETEQIVDLVAGVEGFGEGVWADLGTGSGAIAIGIGRMVGENGRVVATDLSEVAVDVARFNVGRYKLETNGDKQSEHIVDFMTTQWSNAFYDIKIVADFAGIKRFVTGFRR